MKSSVREEMREKERWSSGTTFVLAAIGAAIGIGNVWRFPYICYSNGGGAFLIPYIIALITVGLPLLILEFGIGRKARGGAPFSFRKLIGRRFAWIGWLSVLVGFAIITYYCVIMAWAVNYTFFSASLAWGSDPETFFFDNFLHISESVLSLGSINLLVVAGALISWLWIYISIFKGVNSVEKMIWITVLAPWFLIIIFVIRGITLPGAMDGLAYYLTQDFSVLLKPDVWIAAYGQIFFTLSLGWGVMIAYASLLPEKTDITRNAIIIVVSNSLTSFVAGLAVFSTLGYLAQKAGVPVSSVIKGGIELAFITYPAVISLLPFAPEVFGVMFFFMIVVLGVDSAFATVEATSIALSDYINAPKWLLAAILCITGFTIGLLFTTDAGYYWLDIFDYYLSVFLLVVVGLLEAVAIGYFYDLSILRKFINERSEINTGRWWDICIKVIVPGFLSVILITGLSERLGSPYGGYPSVANAVGWGLVVLIPLLSVVLAVLISGKYGRKESQT